MLHRCLYAKCVAKLRVVRASYPCWCWADRCAKWVWMTIVKPEALHPDEGAALSNCYARSILVYNIHRARRGGHGILSVLVLGRQLCLVPGCGLKPKPASSYIATSLLVCQMCAALDERKVEPYMTRALPQERNHKVPASSSS